MRSRSSALNRAAAGVYAALAAQVVSVTALAVFEETRGRRLAAQIAAFGGDPASPAARTVSGAATAFAVLVLLAIGATVACAAAYLSWLRLVRQGTPPVALAAACLVPGVNLVVPPFLADLAWREGPAGRPRRNGGIMRSGDPARGEPYGAGDRTRWLVVLACWWMSWLAALGLVFAGPARDGLTGLGTAQAAAIAVAALLCASAVREVTLRHAGAGRKRTARPAVRPQVRLGSTLDQAERPSGRPVGDRAAGSGTAATGAGSDAQRSEPGPTASGRAGNGGEEDHRPGGGPELPELACQSRRWGADGWPGSRPSRTAGGAPLSE
ncbi:DUF4328 domain-containing protein [Microbispora sp. SCL1-1]|nr:DUF4328 domain-containing protein [Microbispora sp. SCL1-1]